MVTTAERVQGVQDITQKYKVIDSDTHFNELRTLVITSFNDGMAQVQQQSGNRIFPQAMLPAWEDQTNMMKEARRAIEDLHMTGFVMGDNPGLIGLPEYSEPFWQPFFEFVNAKRVPLNFHLGNSSFMESGRAAWTTFGGQRRLAVGSTMF